MLDLNPTRIDPLKSRDGTYWALSVDRSTGTFLADLVDAPPADKGWIRVATPGIQYERAYMEAQEPFRDRIRDGSLTDEERTRIEGTAIALGGVLREWGNIGLGANAIPYSEEKAVSLLSDVRWTNFRQIIWTVASNRAALRARELEDAKGNSQGGSGGSFEAPTPAATTSSSTA
jgi:hypothetical protein